MVRESMSYEDFKEKMNELLSDGKPFTSFPLDVYQGQTLYALYKLLIAQTEGGMK